MLTSLPAQVLLAHVGVVEQLAPGALEAVAAELQDEAAVRHGQRLLRVLLDHEDGRAVAVDREQRIEHDLDHARVEPQRRLVDHQQSWIQQQRDRHLEDLLLAAGERAGRRAALGREHRETRQQRLDVAAHAGVAAQIGAHLEVLLDAHRREVAAPLRDMGPRSTTTTRAPRRARKYAEAQPTIPAPTTTTSASRSIDRRPSSAKGPGPANDGAPAGRL